jgi:hypothetical protein
MTDELVTELRRLQPGAVPKELSSRVLAKAHAALAKSTRSSAPQTKLERGAFALVVLVCVLESSWLVAFFSSR